MNLRLLFSLLLIAAVCHGAPMTPRELEFLIRQRTPDAEIVQEATRRKLLVPVDATGVQALRHVGASEALIAALRQPGMALPPEAARAEVQRQQADRMRLSQSAAEEAAAHTQNQLRQQTIAAQVRQAGTTRQMLDGLLVRLEGDELKPFSARSLEGVKIFGFYYSAVWCGPCRKFMPQLRERYQQLKAQYPGMFEIIFVSSDRDEFNMSEYMRSYRMPWPAVRFGAATPDIQQFAGKSIPWLVLVSDSGVSMTENGVDKKYIAPELVLDALEKVLPKIAR